LIKLWAISRLSKVKETDEIPFPVGVATLGIPPASLSSFSAAAIYA